MKKSAAAAIEANVVGVEAAEAEVEETSASQRKCFDWHKNKRSEMLLAQINGAGVKAYLTSKANVKPDKDGKGGIQ